MKTTEVNKTLYESMKKFKYTNKTDKEGCDFLNTCAKLNDANKEIYASILASLQTAIDKPGKLELIATALLEHLANDLYIFKEETK